MNEQSNYQMRTDAASFAPNRVFLYAMFVAIVLAALMSLTAGANRNPDEFHHLAAAHYYITHFIPPEIGDPAVRGSYSVWGTSYLDYQWIEYFLAGKFILLFEPVLGSELLAARFFNVALFTSLIIFFAVKIRTDPHALIIPSFFLITPQIWYIFGYFNNDAFAFFIAALLAYQLASPASITTRFFNGEKPHLCGGVWFGVLAGTLLICKSNYWIFLIFAGLWLALQMRLSSGLIKKLAFVGLVGTVVLCGRIGLDLHANGETNFVGVSYVSFLGTGTLRAGSRLRALQEEIAAVPFKPSTFENDPAQTEQSVLLRAKGVEFSEIFTKWKFHTQSFKSFVGVYGYMDKTASSFYYVLFACLYFLFGGYLVFSVVRTRDGKIVMQLCLLVAGLLATVLISALLSWTYAFQAQGRYLFPAIPMLGVFIYANRLLFDRRFMNFFLAAAFFLSVYSFVFVGLPRIND